MRATEANLRQSACNHLRQQPEQLRLPCTQSPRTLKAWTLRLPRAGRTATGLAVKERRLEHWAIIFEVVCLRGDEGRVAAVGHRGAGVGAAEMNSK